MTPETTGANNRLQTTAPLADWTPCATRSATPWENFTRDIPQDEPQPDDGERQQRTGSARSRPSSPPRHTASRVSSASSCRELTCCRHGCPLRGWRWFTRREVSAKHSLARTWFMPWRPEAHSCAGKPKPPCRLYIDGECPPSPCRSVSPPSSTTTKRKRKPTPC